MFLAANTLAGVIFATSGQSADADTALTASFNTGQDPASDDFIHKYVSMEVWLEVVEGARASLPIDRNTVGLLLAEVRQHLGDLPGAVGIVEHLVPNTLTTLSLAELYALSGEFDEVIAITEGCENLDDATALLCIFRGVAFREKALYTASRECFSDGLKSKKRDPAVRHRAWWERSKCYAAEGQRARARADLERILSEDSGYSGIAEALDTLS